MNEAKPPESSVPPAPATSRPPSLATAIAFASGLAAIGLAAWIGALSVRLEATREELARRFAASEAAAQENATLLRQNREALEALSARHEKLETKLAEMESQQAALDALYQEFSRSSDERLLVEIEQAVILASQQLAYAGNVELAITALESAEARLSHGGQTRFAQLRKSIARDIERLRAHPAADWARIAARLDALAEGVGDWPLAFEQRVATVSGKSASEGDEARRRPPASAAIGVVQAWARDVWREISQLVRIERLDRPEPGLLTPREAFFLRENVRLRLLAARLALLARDGASFRHDLQRAEEWLRLYFAADHPAVKEARQQLAKLAQTDIGRTPAALEETLAAVRHLRQARTAR